MSQTEQSSCYGGAGISPVETMSCPTPCLPGMPSAHGGEVMLMCGGCAVQGRRRVGLQPEPAEEPSKRLRRSVLPSETIEHRPVCRP